MARSLREERVDLVQQEDGIPQRGQSEDLLQSILDLLRSRSQIPTGDGKQWLSARLSHGLGGCRLAHARHAMEEDDQAPALTNDQILADALHPVFALHLLVQEVRVHEGLDQVFVVPADLEVLEPVLRGRHLLRGGVRPAGQTASRVGCRRTPGPGGCTGPRRG